MTRSRPTVEVVEGFERLKTVRRGNLRCVSIDLKSGGTCLYSPVEKCSGAFVDETPVQFLLAPNHYHNKAIGEFSAAFADAELVCSEFAKPRLEKIASKEFSGLFVLADQLPDGATLVEPEGLKTGEVWLCVRSGDRLAWIVTDAFCGFEASGGDQATVGFLKTFPKYGVQDPVVFAAWVRKRLEVETPDLILPSHGEPVRGAALKQDILDLLNSLC